jgi:hypothetical protein
VTLTVVHVTKYGRFRPGVLGPVTGVQHHAAGGPGAGTCRVCKRTVVRGAGRWWMLTADDAPECSCAMSEASMVNCAVHGYGAPEL